MDAPQRFTVEVPSLTDEQRRVMAAQVKRIEDEQRRARMLRHYEANKERIDAKMAEVAWQMEAGELTPDPPHLLDERLACEMARAPEPPKEATP